MQKETKVKVLIYIPDHLTENEVHDFLMQRFRNEKTNEEIPFQVLDIEQQEI